MIKMLALSNSDNYQLIYRGRLARHYLRKVRWQLEELRTNGQHVGLLSFMHDIPKIGSFGSLWELVKMKVAALRVIRRYAIVTSKESMKKWAGAVNKLTPGIKVRAFNEHEAHLALQWLNRA